MWYDTLKYLVELFLGLFDCNLQKRLLWKDPLSVLFEQVIKHLKKEPQVYACLGFEDVASTRLLAGRHEVGDGDAAQSATELRK
jgi:hypothetical protein